MKKKEIYAIIYMVGLSACSYLLGMYTIGTITKYKIPEAYEWMIAILIFLFCFGAVFTTLLTDRK